MQVFKRYVSARGVIVFAFEILFLSTSLVVVEYLQGAISDPALPWRVLLATALCLLCLYYHDFYDLTLMHSGRELVVRMLQAVGAASIILAAIYFVAPWLAIRDGVFLSSLAIFLVGIPAWRLLFNVVAETPQLIENILIVGTGPAARTLAHQIVAQRDYAYRVVGFVDDASPSDVTLAGLRVIGGCKEIAAIVTRLEIDRIIVAVSDRRGRLPVDELLRAKLSGVRVEDVTVAYERLTGKILLEDLKPSWLIFSEGFHVSRARGLAKRAIDVSLSIAGLILAAPLIVLTALVVRLATGRPVLYRQERVGQHGRVFTLFKFRSMKVDAEGDTPIWATERDDRVTRVGRVLRLTRLDELPQLWNVLRSDMSFVGPRPERPFFVERLTEQIPFYHQRHAVKPGVTGWAQVKYRYGASVEDAMEKLRYDLYYIKHLSIVFDLTIVVDTVKVILFGRGAH